MLVNLVFLVVTFEVRAPVTVVRAAVMLLVTLVTDFSLVVLGLVVVSLTVTVEVDSVVTAVALVSSLINAGVGRDTVK